ncbi:MAG: twin-arginine translocase TatA/TatE family subunit [Gemmatimonadota bacterium]|nr:twin-arginine translocase TatA/TatE family subunit [Gemmatimonadota bacterium]
MFGLGVWEIILIFGILILVFGARRIPEIGRGLGEGIRNFKGSVRGNGEEDRKLGDGRSKPE